MFFPGSECTLALTHMDQKEWVESLYVHCVCVCASERNCAFLSEI